MSLALLFVLAAFAAFRVSRLLASDTLPLVARPRGWVAGKLPGAWADLVTCEWCLGVYVSAALVALLDLYVSVPLPVLWWGAVAGAVGCLTYFDGG